MIEVSYALRKAVCYGFYRFVKQISYKPQFPPAAVIEAEKMPCEVSEWDLEGREDLTSKQIITIDGDDAKDFDDAVSLEITEDGNYILGVHIADVTHYVTEGSPIDKAAFLRGTSVYLIDTVIPMLPFKLSNDLCSLRPKVVRLTVSVFMEFTPRGRQVGYRISKSFIRSCERMTYNNVTKILEGDRKLCEKYARLVPMLKGMCKLAGILKKKRIRRGEIDFVTREAKITLDADGKPISVERTETTVSNAIIEQFMLICNETVAKHMSELKLPCVYRVHEKPDLLRAERLAEVLAHLGTEFDPYSELKPKTFSAILESVKGADYFEAVNYLVLRTMSKAKYSEKNSGHFGLAADNYCHFTSPIRRYPDLAVHRILKESMDGEISGTRERELREFATGTAISSSMSEVNAAEAEFELMDLKKAEYMADKLGERFFGTVTHVARSGFFVELENTAEGFVAARTIEDDIYVAAENGFEMRGINGTRSFAVGDKVEIRVVSADGETGKIDFELYESSLPCIRRGGKRGTGRKTYSSEEKSVLRGIKEENRESVRQRAELREKADAEREFFENAVSCIIATELCGIKKLTRDEKRFVGVTVSDMAARVIEPLYRSYISENVNYCLEEGLTAATLYTRAVVSEILLGFDTESEFVADFAVRYVRAATEHFDRCLHDEKNNTALREKEYADVELWVRYCINEGKTEDLPDFRRYPKKAREGRKGGGSKRKKSSREALDGGSRRRGKRKGGKRKSRGGRRGNGR